MKNLISAVVVLCASAFIGLALPGCESTQSRNDLLVDIAVSQGVIRFVDAGATDAEDVLRREQLIAALSVARQFVTGDQPFDGNSWAPEFMKLMDWDSLSVPDQILLAQVLEVVRQEIDLRTGGELEVKVYLGRLIDVAINTASQM